MVESAQDKFTKLALKAQKGDITAASKLYEELFGKVFGFCMNRVANREASEDITQEIFLKLVDKLKSFDPSRGGFLSWFWQLSRNTITDYHRRQKDIKFSEVGDNAIENLKPVSPHLSLDNKLSLEKIRDFMKTLSEDDQQVFELHFIANHKYKEISEILGKSEGALRVAVGRLKQKIRKNLEIIIS